MIKAVIFDLDDTLYEEKEFVMSGFKAVSEYISEKHNLENSKILKILQHDFEKGLRKKNFNVLLQKLNLTGESADNLVKIYRKHLPALTLFSDAEHILPKLKSEFKLGLMTDGHITTQENKIKALGIKDNFNAIIINDLAKGISKADKQPFSDILSQLKIEPENTVFIGDNPLKDFAGAKSLGIHTIKIMRDTGQYSNITVDNPLEADHIISTLSDLPEIIEKCGTIVRGSQHG